MRYKSILFTGIAILTMTGGNLAHACVDGLELASGESCEVDVKWGYDHWVVGDFTEGESTISFEHMKGDCNVSLFGPANAVLSPDLPPFRSIMPGEYHLFTRAISLAQQECRYRISVE